MHLWGFWRLAPTLPLTLPLVSAGTAQPMSVLRWVSRAEGAPWVRAARTLSWDHSGNVVLQGHLIWLKVRALLPLLILLGVIRAGKSRQHERVCRYLQLLQHWRKGWY